MKDCLTESVARLYRAGSEHSQSTQKLRDAADGLLLWLKDNVPDGFTLPCNCCLYPSGEFTQETSGGSILNPPKVVFKITRGQVHTRNELFHFSQLIADGFLEKLGQGLEVEGIVFGKTAEKTSSFIASVDDELAKALGIEPSIVKQLSNEDIRKLAESRLRHLTGLVELGIEKQCFEAASLSRDVFRDTYRYLGSRGIVLQEQEKYYSRT